MPAAPGECASGGRMASPPLSQECLSLAQPGRTTAAFLPEKQTPFARLQGRGMSTMARPAAAVAVGRERLQEASHLHGPQTHTVSQELFILRAELSFPFQPSCLWWNFWVSWPTWVSRPASHQQDMVTRGHIGVATGWPPGSARPLLRGVGLPVGAVRVQAHGAKGEEGLWPRCSKKPSTLEEPSPVNAAWVAWKRVPPQSSLETRQRWRTACERP